MGRIRAGEQLQLELKSRWRTVLISTDSDIVCCSTAFLSAGGGTAVNGSPQVGPGKR